MSLMYPTTRFRAAAAFTLLEMTMSLTIMALVFTTVGSVFVLAAKVMPTPDSAEAASVHQSAALSQLLEDLQVARYITEDTANAVTLVVDDRTGDGLPDRLRYAWSGTIGDPLTLSINGSATVTVAEDVQSFALALTTEPQVVTVSGVTTTSEEVLLMGHSTATTATTRILDKSNYGTGQIFVPTLPAGALDYTVTRVRIRVLDHGPSDGEAYARLYATSGGLPTGSALVETVVIESTIGTSMAWLDIPFASAPARAAGEETIFALERGAGGVSLTIEYDSGGSNGLLTRAKDNDPWVGQSGQGMLVEVYGIYTSSSPTIELTRQIFTSANVTLQVGSATSQTATARLYCEPGQDAAAWWSTFDASPVGMDMNGDGTDWLAPSGAAPASFASGRWDVDGQLTSEAVHTFLDPIIVDVVLGATEANRGGAKFQINADQTGGLAMPIVLRVGQDAAGSHYVWLSTRPLNVTQIEATDLGANLPHVRLLIVPADNAVAMIVNGKPIGTFVYTPVSNTNLRGITSLAEYAYGVFEDVSVRVGGVGVVTTGVSSP